MVVIKLSESESSFFNRAVPQELQSMLYKLKSPTIRQPVNFLASSRRRTLFRDVLTCSTLMSRGLFIQPI